MTYLVKLIYTGFFEGATYMPSELRRQVGGFNLNRFIEIQQESSPKRVCEYGMNRLRLSTSSAARIKNK